MALFESFRSRITGSKSMALELARSQELILAGQETEGILQERLAQLELALEDIGWIRFTSESQQEFSRPGLGKLVHICRLMALKNPLIMRAIAVQSYYVWAQGVGIRAVHPEINDVIQEFLGESHNWQQLMSTQGREYLDKELSATGNIYFALFANSSNGRVRMRTIPFEEIVDIIHNPDDAAEPWYYKRQWTEQGFDPLYPNQTVSRNAYYPDYHYHPDAPHPPQIAGVEVISNVVIYHHKDGGFKNWTYGVPWIYSAIDWAKAQKEFLENWSSIVRAYQKFAWVFKTKGGAAGVNAVKQKFGTTLSTNEIEHNPPPTSGSMAILGDGKDLAPLKTAGATASPEDVRYLLLMVCAATGLPETFFGGVKEGSLATAKSLDRPTELKFKMRQAMWEEIYTNILQFVVDSSASAINGMLIGEIAPNPFGDMQVILPTDPDTGEEIDRTIKFSWPPILESDVNDQINAIVNAATLAGKQPAGTMDKRTLSTYLLQALGDHNTSETVDRLFPDDEGDELADGSISGTTPPTPAAESLSEAAKELRDALNRLTRNIREPQAA